MFELEQHIKALLLENDCVVIPGVGGFIARPVQALYLHEEKLYLPPSRSIGFNPQITVNDGLLIQSYMSVHHLNYSDAVRRVEDETSRLHDALSLQGSFLFSGIGTLIQHADHIEFQPVDGDFPTPSLYGLETLQIQPVASQFVGPKEKREDTLYIPISRKGLRQAVSAAAAVILLFLVATPVGDLRLSVPQTASLGAFATPSQLQSMKAISLSVPDAAALCTMSEIAIEPVLSVNHPLVLTAGYGEKLEPMPERPVVTERTKTTVKDEAAEPLRAETTTASAVRPDLPVVIAKLPVERTEYHVIVASLVSETDAQATVEEFSRKDLSGTRIIRCGKRYRISLSESTDYETALKALDKIRQNKHCKDAWLLTVSPL